MEPDVSFVVTDDPIIDFIRAIIEKMINATRLLVPNFGLVGWRRFLRTCQHGHIRDSIRIERLSPGDTSSETM